jgi:hypothetical protein
VACQSGVVERKNHSLCEMARTMLDEHRTPRRYWAEAVNTAFHVGNQIFLRAFLNKSEPFQGFWLSVLHSQEG